MFLYWFPNKVESVRNNLFWVWKCGVARITFTAFRILLRLVISFSRHSSLKRSVYIIRCGRPFKHTSTWFASLKQILHLRVMHCFHGLVYRFKSFTVRLMSPGTGGYTQKHRNSFRSQSPNSLLLIPAWIYYCFFENEVAWNVKKNHTKCRFLVHSCWKLPYSWLTTLVATFRLESWPAVPARDK